MRRPAFLRALTLTLAFVHTLPAEKHLALCFHHPSAGEAWKGLGALLAVGLYLLPVRVQMRALRALWRERRAALRAGGLVLAVVHTVPALDHVPRFVATGQWPDAWRGLGAGLAVLWFLAPLRAQAVAVAAMGRLARLSSEAVVAARPRGSWT
jgi:hypothetical protein